jgi:enoyl-CoA hydratase/carnithine racemase
MVLILMTFSFLFCAMYSKFGWHEPLILIIGFRVLFIFDYRLARQFHDTIGRRQAELGLSLGLLYSPEQALDIGLVDELVPTKESVLTRAEQVALEWGRIPPQARVASKMLMRQEAIDHLIKTRQADTDHFVGFVTHPKVQQNLTAYLEMLAAKKKK